MNLNWSFRNPTYDSSVVYVAQRRAYVTERCGFLFLFQPCLQAHRRLGSRRRRQFAKGSLHK